MRGARFEAWPKLLVELRRLCREKCGVTVAAKRIEPTRPIPERGSRQEGPSPASSRPTLVFAVWSPRNSD